MDRSFCRLFSVGMYAGCLKKRNGNLTGCLASEAEITSQFLNARKELFSILITSYIMTTKNDPVIFRCNCRSKLWLISKEIGRA